MRASTGVSDLERITYRAAEGEHPVIKGSERITTWERDRGNVWKVTLPNTFFGAFNPYREPIFGDWLNTPDRNTDAPKHLGDVYLNGRSFYEVTDPAELDDPQIRTTLTDNALQITRPVDDPDQTRYVWYCEVDERAETTTIWANFQGADPNAEMVEINVRRSCFFPSRTHIDYISVIGFEMAQAATPWAPPTAPQIGMVGPNWARGWIIRDNILHDAKCSAVCLGKEASTGDNEWYRTERKTGYQYQLEAVFKGLRVGWTKGVVGGHRVIGNTIHHCGQNAIVGHMGCAFSEIAYNHCHHIGLKREFFGWEVAGIKFHAALDTQIHHNDIHDCSLPVAGLAGAGHACQLERDAPQRTRRHDRGHPRPVPARQQRVRLAVHVPAVCPRHRAGAQPDRGTHRPAPRDGPFHALPFPTHHRGGRLRVRLRRR